MEVSPKIGDIGNGVEVSVHRNEAFNRIHLFTLEAPVRVFPMVFFGPTNGENGNTVETEPGLFVVEEDCKPVAAGAKGCYRRYAHRLLSLLLSRFPLLGGECGKLRVCFPTHSHGNFLSFFSP